jgi:flagellar hook-length control protein FliK
VPATGTPAATGGIPLPALTGLTPASAADAPAVELPALPAEPPAEAPATAPAAAAPAATGEQASSEQHPQQQPGAQTAAPAAAKPADAPAPAAPATPAMPIAQAAPAMPAGAPAGLERAVPLSRAPETTATLIQIAAERGVTHAKLNLKPVELGGIEVRLQTTPQGIAAQLVADSPEAAKLLQQAADDLRRSLAERDVNLLSLDVSTASDYQQQQSAGGMQSDIFGENYRPGGAHGGRRGSNGDAGIADAPAVAETTLVLPNGVLVDVLA